MFRKGHTGWNKGLTKENDPRVKACAEKISATRRGCTFTDEHKAKLSLVRLGTHPSDEAKAKRSVSMKTVWEDPAYCQKQVESRRKIIIPQKVLEDLYLVKGYTISRIAFELGHDSETVRKHFMEYGIPLRPHGWAQEKLWKDPDFVLKQLKANGARPNKLESYLEGILNNQLPDYKYNGDGRLGIVLAGLVPDFVNVNGKKQIIEVFGDYWHGLRKPKWHQTELGRIMAYNSVGFRCLVIWEHELKELTEEKIVEKISNFSRGG